MSKGYKVSFNDFVNRANLLHNDKFTYDKNSFVNMSVKTKIICILHGEFYQVPMDHLRSNGCKDCAFDKIRLGLFNFINKSNMIHDYKYDYSKSIYKNNKTKLIIICKEHGEFLQKPDNHLAGNKCPVCAGVGKSNNDRFIKSAKIVHGNLYLYDNVNYILCGNKVKITCKIHGDFEQTPENHLAGNGCPNCIYKNQTKVFDVLTQFLPEIKIEKHFKININGSNRFIDFMFIINNNLYYIEYNGAQHYEVVKYFKEHNNDKKREKRFLLQLKRDQEVRKYCQDNKIFLIEIDGREIVGLKIKKFLFDKLKELYIL